MCYNQKKVFRQEEHMNKTIITVVGKDTVGIIAKVCTYLADSLIEDATNDVFG